MCGMGLAHPHDRIQRFHMEAKDLWGPKINTCAPVKEKEKSEKEEGGKRSIG